MGAKHEKELGADAAEKVLTPGAPVYTSNQTRLYNLLPCIHLIGHGTGWHTVTCTLAASDMVIREAAESPLH